MDFKISRGEPRENEKLHFDRFGKKYLPISIPEHIELLKSCGFRVVEVLVGLLYAGGILRNQVTVPPRPVKFRRRSLPETPPDTTRNQPINARATCSISAPTAFDAASPSGRAPRSQACRKPGSSGIFASNGAPACFASCSPPPDEKSS